MYFKLLKIFLICGILLSGYPAPAQTPKVIFLTDFESKNPDPAGKNYSLWIPNQIMAPLVNSRFVTVVERNKLDALLKEQKLSQSDIIDPKTAIKFGKIIGAQKVVMGEYQRTAKGKFDISCRLIDIEKGIIDGQWITSDLKEKEIKKYTDEVASNVIKKLQTLYALERIARLQNPDAPFSVFISAGKDTFHIGEMLNFSVEVDRSCYVMLFDVGTSGRIHLLFPNKMQPNNYIKAGHKVWVENIVVNPPSGTEMVKAIATLDSVSFGKMIELASIQTTFLPLGEDTDQFARDLDVMLSPLPQRRWATANLTFEIIEKKTNR